MGPSPRAQPVEAMAFSETLASGLEKRRHGFCAQCNCAAALHGLSVPVVGCRRAVCQRLGDGAERALGPRWRGPACLTRLRP